MNVHAGGLTQSIQVEELGDKEKRNRQIYTFGSFISIAIMVIPDIDAANYSP